MVTTSGKIFKHHIIGGANRWDIIAALERFRRQVRRPLIVVWDRASIHTARIVMEYFSENKDISAEFLPPYAPELNPEESCHGNVKQRLGNFVPVSIQEMRRMVDNGFARLRRRPDLLLHFFQRSGLRITQFR